MHRASFHLKYYQTNLGAEFLSVQIRMSLAGEGCSSRVLNICCCSQGKNPGEPKQPLGIHQSVCSGFCCLDLLLDDGGGILCPLALIALASLWLLTFGWGVKSEMTVWVWEGSEVFEALCCWFSGLFSTLSWCWQHYTYHAYCSRAREDGSFQDSGGHLCCSLEVISRFSASPCIIRWQRRPRLRSPCRDGWSSAFHSGHSDWLPLINPLNDFRGDSRPSTVPQRYSLVPFSWWRRWNWTTLPFSFHLTFDSLNYFLKKKCSKDKKKGHWRRSEPRAFVALIAVLPAAIIQLTNSDGAAISPKSIGDRAKLFWDL